MNCGVRASRGQDRATRVERTSSVPTRAEGGEVLGAMRQPCSDSALQIGSTLNYRPSITSWRCSSMNLPSVVIGCGRVETSCAYRSYRAVAIQPFGLNLLYGPGPLNKIISDVSFLA